MIDAHDLAHYDVAKVQDSDHRKAEKITRIDL